MAEIINRFSRTAKKIARKTTKKAEEILSVTKYNVKIKAREVDVDEKYEKLGNLYYTFVKNQSEENKAAVDACVAEIDALKEQIASFRKSIAEAKDEIVCTSCGNYISSNKATCPHCKISLERIEVNSAEENSENEEK